MADQPTGSSQLSDETNSDGRTSVGREPTDVTTLSSDSASQAVPVHAPSNMAMRFNATATVPQNFGRVLQDIQSMLPNMDARTLAEHLRRVAQAAATQSSQPPLVNPIRNPGLGGPQLRHPMAHPDAVTVPMSPAVVGEPSHSALVDMWAPQQDAPVRANHMDGIDVNQNSNGAGGIPAAQPLGGGGVRGAGRAAAEGAGMMNQAQAIPGLRAVMRFMEGALPFLVLMFAKVMYDHRLGILIFIGLFGTFTYANLALQRQVTIRASLEKGWWEGAQSLLWIIGFLSANIFFIYFVFAEQQLYSSLYFKVPFVVENVFIMNLWNMLWIIVLTDFVIKFATVILKSVVALLPKQILRYKRKGKYYMFVEVLSQFYRSLLPIPTWVWFLLEDEFGGEWFSIILLILYTVFKGSHVWNKFKELRDAFQKFRRDVSYGSVPSNEDLKVAEDSCPICQDKFTDPVLLACKHIFCEDCVSMWFDRERTCPMCRANIVDNPKWRDGSTACNIQIY